jgi:hypothetical protein
MLDHIICWWLTTGKIGERFCRQGDGCDAKSAVGKPPREKVPAILAIAILWVLGWLQLPEFIFCLDQYRNVSICLRP